MSPPPPFSKHLHIDKYLQCLEINVWFYEIIAFRLYSPPPPTVHIRTSIMYTNIYKAN